MSVETPPSPSRSSLLYAMGKLTAEANAHGQQIAALSTKQDALPDLIVARLQPQFLSLRADLTLHGTRLDNLEKRQWLWMGGGGVVAILLPFVLKHLLPS